MSKTVKVWDLSIRVFHWSLVVLFTVAYLSGEEWEKLHAYAGYGVMALLVYRWAWGFLGTPYARFSHFALKPSEAITYVSSIFSGNPKYYLGHNPLGSWMVLALLVSISVTTWTGLELYADEGKGPLAGGIHLVSPSLANGKDKDREHGRDDDEEEWLEDLHEVFSELCLILIVLHVSGVIFSSLVHKENLVKSMIFGDKPEK